MTTVGIDVDDVEPENLLKSNELTNFCLTSSLFSIVLQPLPA